MAADTDALTDVVKASPEAIVKALTDFDAYPQWQSGVLECTVKERDDEGRGSLVEMFVDAKIRKLRYQVRYFYDLDNGNFGWDYAGGDLQECTGRYQLTPQADGTTELTIDIVTEIGFFVPGPMKKLIRDQSLKNSMRDLKKLLE
jgi:ribosome-associated toxin RatA of RatAB toxin-antitoxin module